MNWVEVARIEEILDGAVEVANVGIVDDALYLDYLPPCAACESKGWASYHGLIDDCGECLGDGLGAWVHVECTASEYAIAVQWALRNRGGARAEVAKMVLAAARVETERAA